MAGSATVVAVTNGRPDAVGAALIGTTVAALSGVVLAERMERSRLAWRLSLVTAASAVAMHLVGSRRVGASRGPAIRWAHG